MPVDRLPGRRCAVCFAVLLMGFFSSLPAARAQDTVPPAPNSVSAQPGSGEVRLSWAAVSLSETGGSTFTNSGQYNIYRATSPGGEGASPLATVEASDTSYTDTSAVDGMPYYYQITAVQVTQSDIDPTTRVESDRSMEIHATPQMRINCGGDLHTDNTGRLWGPDREYGGGGVITTTAAITGTHDPKLCQTQRSGSYFLYTVPVANGTYVLTLLFAEIEGKTIGQRVFNVTANGTQVLTNFDISVAARGSNKAVAKQFGVTVTDGQFRLSFHSVTGNAAVVALSLLPATVKN